MILKNLNVVGAVHNCFKGMITNEALDADASPEYVYEYPLKNVPEFLSSEKNVL